MARDLRDAEPNSSAGIEAKTTDAPVQIQALSAHVRTSLKMTTPTPDLCGPSVR